MLVGCASAAPVVFCVDTLGDDIVELGSSDVTLLNRMVFFSWRWKKPRIIIKKHKLKRKMKMKRDEVSP